MEVERGHHGHFPPKRSSLQPILLRAIVIVAIFTLGSAFGFHFADRKQQQRQQLREVWIAQRKSEPPPPLPPHDLLRFRTECAPPLPRSDVLPVLLRHIYNGTSPFDGFPPQYVAPLLRSRRVRGWGSTAPVFEELIRSVRPETIVEVGTFLGASALHMANITRRLGLRSTILCLDDFRGWPGFRILKNGMFRDIRYVNGDSMLMYQFMRNVAEYGEEGRVLPVPFSTSSALVMLCELGVYGDLVEVDAGHDFHSAWSDINLAWAVVREGGVLFGHDYFLAADDHGVRRAVQLFAKVKGLQVKPNGQHWVLYPPKGQETVA